LEALKEPWNNEYLRENWYSNVTVSREILKTSTLTKFERQKFVFKEFSLNGWDFLDESALQFRRRVGLAFRQHLARSENAKLKAFERRAALSEYRNSSAEFITNLAWRDQTLRQFDKSLNQYLATMNRRKTAIVAKHDLLEMREKPKLNEHLGHTVRYQIPDRKLNALTLTKIAKRAWLRESAISKAINECLSLIGLDKRPDTRGGRRLGSKNSYTSHILNSLAR